MGDWKAATTLEERLNVESEALAYFEELRSFLESLPEVTEFDHPTLHDLGDTSQKISDVLRMNLQRLRVVTRLYLQYFNNQQVTLAELIGSLKRARQKRATLAIWNQEVDKHVFREFFLNFDRLDFNFVQDGKLAVLPNQGAATLPIRTSSNLSIGRIIVGPESSGFAGSSELGIQLFSQDPVSILDGNPDTWFEFERMDSGPAILQLACELNNISVLNQIDITPISFGYGLAYEIEDIVFVNGATSTSIKQLLPQRLASDFYTVKTLGNDTVWSAAFLPVKAKSVLIKFKQDSSYSISTHSRDGRTVNRKRFAIGVSSIALRRNEYEPVGGVNSRNVKLPPSLYAVSPQIDVHPLQSPLYSYRLDLSADGGQTWSDISNQSGLLDGSRDNFVWRLSLSRNVGAFENAVSLTEAESITELDFTRTGISKTFSPTSFQVSSKPRGGNVFVYQPGIARFTNKRSEAILVGTWKGQTALPVPFDFTSVNIDIEDVVVMANRQELNFSTVHPSALAVDEWTFSSDFSEINIGTLSAGSSARIEMYINSKRMFLQERSDGYYYVSPNLFDADKGRIRIESLGSVARRRNLVLPLNRSRISLKARNIIASSFTIEADSTTFNPVGSVDDIALDTDYYLDVERGWITFNAELGTILHSTAAPRVSFLSNSLRELPREKFAVVTKGSKPWALRIDKDSVSATTFVDTKSAGPQSRLGFNGEETRLDMSSANTKAMTLTHDYIIRGSVRVPLNLMQTSSAKYPVEVEYIDGVTEFLGLVPMDNEKTTAITADSSGIVSFALAAREGVYSPLGIRFSDTVTFQTEVSNPNALGEYAFDAQNGVVQVYVGPGGTLESGIELLYYYKDPEHDPANLYSLNYEDGFLYSSEDLNQTAEVNYKAASYKISYDVVQEISSAEYDPGSGTVSVRTEDFSDANNLVKAMWAKPIEGDDVSDLERYFSPIVGAVGFKFQ